LTLSPADFGVKTEKSRCFLRGSKIRFRFSLHMRVSSVDSPHGLSGFLEQSAIILGELNDRDLIFLSPPRDSIGH
jgi:hypothetical protein